MDQAATTSKARNHAVRQHRGWRGGKWRTFAAGGAPRGAPRIQGRPHHARLLVSARSRRAAAATPSGHEPSPAPTPADSSRAIGNPHAACRDHSRTHARGDGPPRPGGPPHVRHVAHAGAWSAPPRPASGQRAVTTCRRRDAERSRTVARADPSRQFPSHRQPARGVSLPLARHDPTPGNTKRGRPEGRPRGGVWRESC